MVTGWTTDRFIRTNSTASDSTKAWVVVMDRDGTNKKRLTAKRWVQPSWSRDGTEIIAICLRECPRRRGIYRIDPAQPSTKQHVAWTRRATSAAWSPTRDEIVFSGRRHGKFGLFIKVIGVSGIKKVTTGSREYSQPAWSPNGNRIVFTKRPGDRGVAPGDLWKARRDGSGSRRLTATYNAIEASSWWAPNGDWTVFCRINHGGGSDLFRIRPNGQRERPLEEHGCDPTWQRR